MKITKILQLQVGTGLLFSITHICYSLNSLGVNRMALVELLSIQAVILLVYPTIVFSMPRFYNRILYRNLSLGEAPAWLIMTHSAATFLLLWAAFACVYSLPSSGQELYYGLALILLAPIIWSFAWMLLSRRLSRKK